MQDLTIVISVLNGMKTILQTLNSLNSCVEEHGATLIIYDAGSKDATIKIIKECALQYTLICEKDHGLYHAWNKAIERAKTDYIFFINSDDSLIGSEKLSILLKSLKSNKELVAASGNTKMTRQDGKIARRGRKLCHNKFYGEMPLVTPATIFSRDALLGVGKFDLQFKIASDYDLVQRLLLKHGFSKFVYFNLDIVNFSIEGMSNTQTSIVNSEIWKIFGKNLTLFDQFIHLGHRLTLLLKRKILEFYLRAT